MKILGNPGPIRNSVRYARSGNGAVTTITRYQGTRDAVASLISVIPPGHSFDFDDTEAPMATLTVISPDWDNGEEVDIPPIFELTGALSEKSIFEHWRTQAIPAAQKDAILIELDSKPRVVASGLNADAQVLREMLYDEQTGFAQDTFIFSTTQLISGRRSVPIAYNNTNTLYDNAQVIRETKAPALYITGIQEAFDTVKNDFYLGNIRDGHVLSWLKHAPSISTVAGGRSAVRIEYWLSPWRTYTYKLSSAPR